MQPRKDAYPQIDRIKKALDKATVVYHCGCPDREGQLVVDQLLHYLSYRGEVKRLWLNSMAPESINSEIAKDRSNIDFKSLSLAASARTRTDWLIGINLTRACTLIAEQSGFEGVLSFGRIQTPILGLIVARDRAVEQGDRSVAVQDYERKGVHSLTSLQRLMFSKVEASPSEVLSALEALYFQYRAITLPYTDSHQLFDYLADTHDGRLSAIKHNLGIEPKQHSDSPLYRKTDGIHMPISGIVPTEVFIDVDQLDELSKLLYVEIAKQFVRVVMGEYQIELEPFKSLRYTEQSLLVALESVAPFVENSKIADRLLPGAGFGAPRTRVAQLEGLIRRDYVVRGSQHLVSTQAGRDLVDAFPANLGSVDFLGRWELGLQQLERGQLSYSDYMAAVKESLDTWVERIVSKQISVRSATDVLDGDHGRQVLACAKCGSELIRRSGAKGDFLGCSSYPDCDYTRQLLVKDKRVF